MSMTQEYLKSRLRYRPETGLFYWIKADRRFLNKRAGGHSDQGYIVIYLLGRLWRAHRLAFLYVHGFMPPMVDHKNTVRGDNRIKNLRECNKSQNGANRSAHNTSTGFRGVILRGNRYRAQITHMKKCYPLGYYDTPEEASEVYEAKRLELFGDFT